MTIIIDDVKNYTLRMLEFLYEHNQGVMTTQDGKSIVTYKSYGRNGN